MNVAFQTLVHSQSCQKCGLIYMLWWLSSPGRIVQWHQAVIDCHNSMVVRDIAGLLFFRFTPEAEDLLRSISEAVVGAYI